MRKTTRQEAAAARRAYKAALAKFDKLNKAWVEAGCPEGLLYDEANAALKELQNAADHQGAIRL